MLDPKVLTKEEAGQKSKTICDNSKSKNIYEVCFIRISKRWSQIKDQQQKI
jgi:hypothetical protein